MDLAKSGNEYPLGLAYRQASGRVRPPENVVNAVKLYEGYTATMENTLAKLLAHLCPDDNPLLDSPYHRQSSSCADPI